VAALLQCESFNLYSTARRFKVPVTPVAPRFSPLTLAQIYRAEPRLVKLLFENDIISANTKSVSLLNLSESMDFLKGVPSVPAVKGLTDRDRFLLHRPPCAIGGKETASDHR
jgi:hypothetical protein